MSELQLTFADIGRTDRYVREITYDETKPFILGIHYARRMPTICHAFGLFEGGVLVGIVTYGIPASPSLCIGIAGKENQHNVMELNRLVMLPGYNGDNRASFLVGRSLKMLPRYTFVVSYADTAWTHIGYVYQATNFLYTGATKARTDMAGEKGGHSRHYKVGEKHRVYRSSKHRYVYLVGNKRDRRKMKMKLKYPVMPYPKGDERRYDPSDPKQMGEKE